MTHAPALEETTKGEFDSDGYPTEESLERIEKWPHEDHAGLMAFAESIWRYADWGWRRTETTDELMKMPIIAYDLSTGGWSGNESIIAAMKLNQFFWMFCWVQSRRGGHYIFHLKPCP